MQDLPQPLPAGGQQQPLPHLDVGAGLLTGLAFWQGSLYVAVANSGSIIRVPLRNSGGAGTPQITAQANLLRTADGIAFDTHGNLYITVNTNHLVWPASGGALTELAAKNNGLAYPTMPAFGTTPATRTTLYITNGALANGTPNIVAFDAAVPGLPLPQTRLSRCSPARVTRPLATCGAAEWMRSRAAPGRENLAPGLRAPMHQLVGCGRQLSA